MYKLIVCMFVSAVLYFSMFCDFFFQTRKKYVLRTICMKRQNKATEHKQQVYNVYEFKK